ncbi:hemoglobin-like flavoprotein [Leptolyngbya sp. PCC 7375]|nr:hemoglobin-like flavoprotein [Leptolyngbya sp. PCC 7375]
MVMRRASWQTVEVTTVEIVSAMALNTNLLKTSFTLLKEDQSAFSDLFYSTLFSDYPQVKPLFAHTNMDEQPKKLFASLVLVVENLVKPDVLTAALQGLGTRHIKYGVLPEHYPMVGGTLLKSMETILQDDWTPEISAAWTEAYAAITEIMLEGADYPAEILNPHNTVSV